MEAWFGVALSKCVAPLIDFLSWFKRPECQITTAQYLDIKARLKNGDSLFSRTDWELTNPLLPGYWKHTAIYLNGWVYQAVTAGVNKISLEEFVFKKDHIGAASIAMTQAECDVAQAYCEKQLGDGYDFDFLWGVMKKWYCAKLTYWAYKEASPDNVKLVPSLNVLGIEHISPTDMWQGLAPIGTWNVSASDRTSLGLA
jgi:uncharacterized protein YycO